jgi:hypothetical protein
VSAPAIQVDLVASLGAFKAQLAEAAGSLAGMVREMGATTVATVRASEDARQQVEDKYAALRATNWNESLAGRLLALNRELGRELAAVSGNEQLKAEILGRYNSQVAQIQQQAAGASAGGQRAAAAATKETEGATKGFLGTLLAYKAEQTQQGRAARFFAGEILSVVPASAEAKATLTDLVGVMLEGAAGGAAFGLGLEVAKFAIGQAVQAWQAYQEELRAARAIQSVIATSAADAAQRVRETVTPLTEGQRAYREEVAKSALTLGKANEELQKLIEKGPGLFAYVKAGFGDDSGFRAHQRQIEQLNEQMRKGISTARNYGDQLQALAQETARRESDARGTALVEKGKERDHSRALERIQLESQARIAAISNEFPLAKQLNELALERETLQKTYAEDIKNKAPEEVRALTDKLRLQLAINDAKRREIEAGAVRQAEKTNREGRRNLDIEEEQIRRYGEEAAADAAKERMRDVQQYMAPIAGGINQLFGELIDNGHLAAQSLERAFKGIVKSFASMLVEMGAKRAAAALVDKLWGAQKVSENAAVAASGAAASQAEIPIVGPGMALAAMAAMFAAVIGLQAVFSSAGGNELPRFGGPFPTLLHPDETVLPADLSVPLKDALRGGSFSGGGDTYNVSLAALDTQSFETALRANAPALIKVVRDLARAGRL